MSDSAQTFVGVIGPLVVVLVVFWLAGTDRAWRCVRDFIVRIVDKALSSLKWIVFGHQVGSDGYPHNISRHAERCQCVRCLGRLHRNIDRLERELGMGEYAGREESDEGRIVTGATLRITAATITADQIVGHPWPLKVTDE